MGTRAEYFLWIGVLKEDLPDPLPEPLAALEAELDAGSDNKAESWGKSLSHIYMHGENIGIGTIITELEWVTADTRPDIVNPDKLNTLSKMKSGMRAMFNNLGLPASVPVEIYHHLDLGG